MYGVGSFSLLYDGFRKSARRKIVSSIARTGAEKIWSLPLDGSSGDLARVTELYGETYSQNDSELIFTKGNTSLCLILNGDTVISIEYRMVV